MADIALCVLSPKPLAKCKTCKRNMAITPPNNFWQSMCEPKIKENDCEHYWKAND